MPDLVKRQQQEVVKRNTNNTQKQKKQHGAGYTLIEQLAAKENPVAENKKPEPTSPGYSLLSSLAEKDAQQQRLNQYKVNQNTAIAAAERASLKAKPSVTMERPSLPETSWQRRNLTLEDAARERVASFDAVNNQIKELQSRLNQSYEPDWQTYQELQKAQDKYANLVEPYTAKDALDSFMAGYTKLTAGGIEGLLGALDEAVTRRIYKLGGKDASDYKSGLSQMAQEDLAAAQDMRADTSLNSDLAKRIDDLAVSAGQQLGTATVGNYVGAGMAPYAPGSEFVAKAAKNARLMSMVASAGGANIIDAKDKGATNDQALMYGILTGATEAVTEKLFGGNPLFDTDAGLVNRVVGKIVRNRRFLSVLDSIPVELMNEGLEEMISEVLQPVSEYLTYGDTYNPATLEQVIDAGINGVILAGVMQGGNAVLKRSGNAIANAADQRAYNRAYNDEIARILEAEEANDQAETAAETQAPTEQAAPQAQQPAQNVFPETQELAPAEKTTPETPTERVTAQDVRNVLRQQQEQEAEPPKSLLDQYAEAANLGEKGAEALKQIYQDGDNPGQLTEEATAFYNAGRTNKEFQYGSQTIGEEQARVMYNAGQMDTAQEQKTTSAPKFDYYRDYLYSKKHADEETEYYPAVKEYVEKYNFGNAGTVELVDRIFQYVRDKAKQEKYARAANYYYQAGKNNSPVYFIASGNQTRGHYVNHIKDVNDNIIGTLYLTKSRRDIHYVHSENSALTENQIIKIYKDLKKRGLWINEAESMYLAGKFDAEHFTPTQPTQEIGPEQARVMYNAGQMDAIETGNDLSTVPDETKRERPKTPYKVKHLTGDEFNAIDDYDYKENEILFVETDDAWRMDITATGKQLLPILRKISDTIKKSADFDIPADIATEYAEGWFDNWIDVYQNDKDNFQYSYSGKEDRAAGNWSYSWGIEPYDNNWYIYLNIAKPQEAQNENVLRQGSERDLPERTGEQVAELGEGTAAVREKWERTGTPADAQSENLHYGEAVKAQTVLPQADADETFYVDESDTESTRNMRALAEHNGLDVVGFGGGEIGLDVSNTKLMARGWADTETGKIYVQTDNSDFTGEDLARHEIMEQLIAHGEANVDEILSDAEEVIGKDLLNAVIEAYADPELTQNPAYNLDDARREIVCDAADHINQWRGYADKHGTKEYGALADAADKVIGALHEIVMQHTGNAFNLKAEASPIDLSTRADDELIRLSRRIASLETLEAENELLKHQLEQARKQVERWKRETKVTKKPTLRAEDIESVARKAIKDYSSKATVEEITPSLTEVANKVLNNEYPDVKDVRQALEQVAGDIAGKAIMLTDPSGNYDVDGRDVLAALKAPIKISAEEAHAVWPVGKWKTYRDSVLKYLDVAINQTNKNAKSVDVAYNDLANDYPWLFDPNITDATEQIIQMVRVAESLTPYYENPFQNELPQVVEYIANDLAFAVIDDAVIRLTPPTKADKMLAQMKEQASSYEKKLQEQRDALIKEGKEKVKKAVEKAKSKMNSNQDAAKLRAKITKHVTDMSRKLLNPTDKKHVMDDLQKPVRDVLLAINLESKYEVTRKENGSYARVKRGTENAEATNRTKAWQALKNAMLKKYGENQLSVDEIMYGLNNDDPDAEILFDEVINMADTPISRMNVEQLQKVWKVVRAVEHSITTADKMFSDTAKKRVSDNAEWLRDANKGKSRLQAKSGPLRTAQDLLIGNEKPVTFFHQFGEPGDALFWQIIESDREVTRILDTAIKKVEWLTSKEYDVRQAQKEKHKVTLGDETVELTTAQIIELYNDYIRGQDENNLSGDGQGAKHLLNGGMRLENTNAFGVAKGSVEPIANITQEQIIDAYNSLSEKDKKANEIMHEAMSFLADEGNAASLYVFGYEKFTERNYWPLNVDKNQTQTKLNDAGNWVMTPASMSLAKPTNPNASNALIIGDAFETFAKHASDMATYAARLPVQTDLMRIFNYQFKDENGIRTGTVKGVFDRVSGKYGQQYFKKLMSDMAGGMAVGDSIKLMDKMISLMKAGSVVTNLRVMAQQAPAVLRGADVINPSAMEASLFTNPLSGWKKAKEHSAIAKWKSWGFYDVGYGPSVETLLFHNDSTWQKIQDFQSIGTGAADAIGWGRLWNACEIEIKTKNKGKPDGWYKSNEFYKKVDDLFTEAIYKTQVVDGITQRSDNMRKQDTGAKMATAFMAEPTTWTNMLQRSIFDLRYAKGKREKLKATGKLVRTAYSGALAAAVTAAFATIFTAAREDDREKKLWEKWLKDYPSVYEDIITPLDALPIIRDVKSLAEGHSATRTDLSIVENFIRAYNNLSKSIEGKSQKSLYNSVADVIAESGRLAGVGAANFKRDVLSVLNTYANDTNNYLLQYSIDNVLYTVTYKDSTGKLRVNSRFYNTLFRAYQNDTEQYKIIYDKLKEAGVSDKQITDAMNDRLKDAAGVSHIGDLSAPYYTPSGQARYNSDMSNMTRTDVWKNATSKQRDTAKDTLHDLITGESKDTQELREKIAGGKSVGLTEWEYALYKTALEMYDEPNENNKLKTYTNEEYEKAIRALDLTPAESEYLWLTIAGRKEKNMPDW